jgi:hypothetical protein
MKIQQNSICICGHIAKEHEYRGPELSFQLQNICWDCRGVEIKNGAGFLTKAYHKFKPDNLRFLEICYEEKATEA